MKSKWFKFYVLPVIMLASCNTKQDVDPGTEQLANEISAINTYIGTNYPDEYTVPFQSGIGMVVFHFGEGAPPHTGQKVKVSYTTRLFSDSIYFENKTVEEYIENISPQGLQFAISTMTEGSLAAVFVPSKYAYGTTGTTNVPANSTLVYNISLISVTKTSVEQTQFNIDTAAIHQSLIKDSVQNAILHPTGIWYTIDVAGTGNNPKVYDFVDATYKGTLMSNGTVIENRNVPLQSIYNLIDGLKIGVPLMKEGGEATFYIPSGLAYGKDSSAYIPSNANLKYAVRLNTIKNN